MEGIPVIPSVCSQCGASTMNVKFWGLPRLYECRECGHCFEPTYVPVSRLDEYRNGHWRTIV